MDSFPTFDTESMGGCQSFRFAPKPTVAIIPDAIDEVIKEEVIFTGSNTWLNGIALRNTLQFTEIIEATPAGDKYKTTIAGMVPKLTPAYQKLFAEMSRHLHIVWVTDNNDSDRISGNLRAGMSFRFDQDSNTTPAGTGGYKFQFYQEWTDPSPFYDLT